jgi:hypothetical protein
MLREIVAPRECLPALMALEWLLLCMEREVVAFQVFLTTEAVVAEVAYESFGRILCEGRLSASPLDARLLNFGAG